MSTHDTILTLRFTNPPTREEFLRALEGWKVVGRIDATANPHDMVVYMASELPEFSDAGVPQAGSK